MRATTLVFALTFALLGTSAHANASDENKYICLDPTKFLPNKQITHSGITESCDTWIDQAQTAPNELAGVTLNASFNAATATAGVKNYLTGWGERKGCCSDGKSAAFKDHKYFCKDPTDWLPDKTYSGPEMSNSETSCKDWVEVDVDIKDEDFTQSWSCDGKSDAIRQKVQNEGAEIMGCCGSTKKSACYKERGNVCADPSSFLPWNLSIAKAADTAAPATRRYTILQRIQRAAVTGKTSPKHGAAPENLLLARRSSSSSLEEVVVALRANLHLHVMDTIREQDPLRRSASSLSPWPSPSLSREHHRMAFAHQEDFCALCYVLQ